MLMNLGKKALFAAVAAMAVGCADDKPPTDPVTTQPANEPATPPSDTSAGAGLNAAPIYFAFDDYTLNESAKGDLTAIAGQMKASAGAVVQVEGHSDERGSTEYNLALGERRAQTVKNFLVASGVEGARVTTISYGEEKPAASGHDEGAWSKNRRAEFVVSGR